MASGAGGQGSHDVLTAPLPVFSAEQAVELASEIFGVDGTATPLDGERDLNFRIRRDGARSSTTVCRLRTPPALPRTTRRKRSPPSLPGSVRRLSF